MWKCVNVQMCRCVDLEMWMWRCVDMEMCRYGDLELKTLQSYAFG